MQISDPTPEPFYPSQVRGDLTELVLPAEPAEATPRDLDEKFSGPRTIYERAAFPAFLALCIYAAWRSLALAVSKHLWFDEIATQIVARQGRLSAIWAALKAGVDGNPPIFHLVEHAAAALPFDEHIAYRLPSILALPVTLICLYLVVRRDDGPLRAFVSASVVLLSQIYTWFAAEARPYGLLIACVAFALLCYQRANRRFWALGLFVCLTLALCLHYYAVFVFVPFLAAELTFTWKMRRVRPLVWAALVLSLAPLAIFWPLLAATKAIYGAHVWSSAQMQWRTDLASYSDYFGTDEPWGWALAGFCIGAVVLSLWRRTPPEQLTEELDDTHEHILALGLVFLPAIGFLIADLAHGAIVPRYCLSAVLGVALASRYALRPLPRRAVLGVAAFVLFVIAVQEVDFWTSPDRKIPPGNSAIAVQSIVDSVHRDDLPVVIADPLLYPEVQHYASSQLKPRLISLVDPGKAVAYIKTDSADEGLVVMRRFAPLNVQDFASFTATPRSFLLYVDHTDYEWVLSQLIDDGKSPRLLAYDDPSWLYLVELKPQ